MIEMMRSGAIENLRRTSMDIIANILNVAVRYDSKTRIMFRASLNHKQSERYFNFLLEMNMLRKIIVKGRIFYETTERGKEFLAKYKALKEFITRKPLEPFTYTTGKLIFDK
jgi:predicted transcriptional regulator